MLFVSEEEMWLFYTLIRQGSLTIAQAKKEELQEKLLHHQQPTMMTMFVLFETYFYVRDGQLTSALGHLERIDSIQQTIPTDLRYYYHLIKGQYWQAVQQFRLSLQQLKIAEGYLHLCRVDKEEEALLYKSMSEMYACHGAMFEAIRYANKALRIYQARYHLSNIIETLLQLSSCYKWLQYYGKAEAHLVEAQQLIVQLQDDVLLSKVWHVASQLALEQQQLDKARLYAIRALECATNSEQLPSIYITIIEIYLHLQDYDQAHVWNQKFKQTKKQWSLGEYDKCRTYHNFFRMMLQLIQHYDEGLISQIEREVIDFFERKMEYNAVLSCSSFMAKYCEQKRKYKYATKFWRKCYHYMHYFQEL